jgi:hypothetical protein
MPNRATYSTTLPASGSTCAAGDSTALKRIDLVISPGARGFSVPDQSMFGVTDVLTWRVPDRSHNFVGKDDGLNPIAKVELHQDPLHVGSDRGFLDDKCGGYLAVR